METKVDNPKYPWKAQNKTYELIQTTFNANLPSTPSKAQNQDHFIEFRKPSKEEKLEIMKLGFRRKQSFQEYYQRKGKYRLFGWKSYQIKYQSIRKTQLYQISRIKACFENDSICPQRRTEGPQMNLSVRRAFRKKINS